MLNTPAQCRQFSCGCNGLKLHDGQESQSSRRSFIQQLGGLGAGAAIGGAGAFNLSSAFAADQQVIDTHHHFYSPSYQKAWLDWDDKYNIPHFPTQVAWTQDKAVEAMDAGGVKKSILSLASTPGVWFNFELPRIIDIVREVNEYGAGMVKKYPGRFGLFAAIPMVDVESSLREINYAFDVLKADGVGIQTNYGDKWPGHPSFAPIFEELNRRKAVVYFHPLTATCCGRLDTGTYGSVIEVPHDTTRAVVNLLLTGSLLKFRDIKWLFSHAGGTIPMLAGRINYFHGNKESTAKFAPNGIEAELKRLYYDTANATHPSSMAALLKLIPPTQITYGSDYPYVPIATQVEALNQQGFSNELLEQIKYRNALALLKKA